MLANLNTESPAAFCYADDPSNCRRYGRLYTWEAARTTCRSLGSGWRLPRMEEWRELAKAYGGVFGDGPDSGKAAFRELVVAGRSGLEMLLGGGGDARSHEYARLEAHGFYWSASEDSPTTARYLNFGKGSLALYDQDGGEKTRTFSVRCVADFPQP